MSYQESYEWIRQYATSGYIDPVYLKEIYKHLDNLETLVKLATPKLPKVKYYPQTRYEPSELIVECPNCEESLLSWEEYSEMSYCPCCGQALDFTESEDD